MRFVTLLSGLLACASLSHGAAFKKTELACSTNSECLRLGQKVLPPRKRWISSTGTGTKAAKRATTSPGIPSYSIMSVMDASGDSLGYVSRANNQGHYGLVQSTSAALRINRPDMTPSNSLIHPGDQVNAYPYLAAQQGLLSDTADLNTGSATHAVLTAALYNQPAGTMSDTNPTLLEYSKRQVETNIFIADSAGRLTTQWTNSDGAAVFPKWFYGDNDAVYLAGDPAVFQSMYRSGREVSITLV